MAKKNTEDTAIRLVTEILEGRGYQVTDMNKRIPNHRNYDLRCRKLDIEIYVDVKGQEPDIGPFINPKDPMPNLFYVCVQPIQRDKAPKFYVLTQDECNQEIYAYWKDITENGTRRGRPSTQRRPSGFRKERLVLYADQWHKLPGWN